MQRVGMRRNEGGRTKEDEKIRRRKAGEGWVIDRGVVQEERCGRKFRRVDKGRRIKGEGRRAVDGGRRERKTEKGWRTEQRGRRKEKASRCDGGRRKKEERKED